MINTSLVAVVLIVACSLVVSYLIEVVFGSDVGMYDAELGLIADAAKRAQLTNREFFSRHLPMMLGFAALLFVILQA